MRLPSDIPLGAGQARAEAIQAHFSTSDEVMQGLKEEMGYVPVPQPHYACPVLNAEMLTTSNWKTYSQNYAMFKGWWDFYNEKLAEVTNCVVQYKNMLSMIETATKKTQRELARATREKLTVDMLKERVLENPEYQAALLELQRYTQAKALLQAKFESLDKSLSMLSRQVEIRRLDLEQVQVGSNMAGRGRPGY